MKNFLIIISCFFIFKNSYATVWRVYPSATQHTLTQAILNAKAFDTILLGSGIYKEGNILINKPLYLKGLAGAIIDGEKKYEIISVKSDAVTIDGLQVQHAGYSSTEDFAGIKIYNARNVSIINNTVIDTYFGIYGQYIRNCFISNNKLYSNATDEIISGNGIHCWKSDSVSIMHNYIKGHRDGIYFEFVNYSMIVSNYSDENLRYGLHFMFSSNNTYVNNIFSKNGSGVAVMYSHHVKMFWNTFSNSEGSAAYGILLKDITDSDIDFNRFFKNTSAVYMEGTSRIKIANNQFIKNGWAFKVSANCIDIEVTKNNFIANTFDVTTNGSVSLNTFNSNYWDKYEGYDLNRDGTGDVPYHPISMFSMVVEKNPSTAILLRSMIVTLMDKAEKMIPSLTPVNLLDNVPLMKPFYQ